MRIAARTTHPVAWWVTTLVPAPIAAGGGFLLLANTIEAGLAAGLAGVTGLGMLWLLGRFWRMSPGAIAGGMVAATVASVPWLFAVGFTWAWYLCTYTDQCPFS